MLVGEAPGEHEDRDLIPFHERAPAGSVLTRILSRGGWKRESFRITNVVWSRPPGNRLDGTHYEAEAIAAWRPHLLAEIDRMKPRAIVALGNVALKTLTNYGVGKGQTITSVRGYVVPMRDYPTWVIPTYHPSYIMQGQHALTGVVIYDLMRACEVASSGFERRPVHFLIDPPLGHVLEFERGYAPTRHHLSYDIETPDSGAMDEEEYEEKDDISYTIVRVSLCYDAESGVALSVPWRPPYIDVVKRMLASSGDKRVWNGAFDDPRLIAAGAPVNGRIRDMMWYWHFLQPTLPRALGFVTPFYDWRLEPWKHMNATDPGWYSGCDALALQQIGDGIERDLRRMGRGERADSHVGDVHALLRRMAETGLPYSQEKADAFRIHLQQMFDERDRTLQERVPITLKPVKQKKGLVGKPRVNGVTLTLPLVEESSVDTHTDVESGVTFVKRVFPEWDDDAKVMTQVVRWAQLEPFLPTSSQQTLALIKHFGHKVGTNRKTRNETTDVETLKRLWKRYRNSRKPQDREAAELYNLIIECRQLSKVLGTYVGGWRPGKDGRIHSTPGFWGKMYRISWRNPNIGATIADKNEAYIATGFRKCIEAPPGHVIIESDWKGMEATLAGWYANDPEYMRWGRLGVHAYLSALVLAEQGRIPQADVPLASWSDEDIKAALSPLKKQFAFEYDAAKHAVFLSQYGGTPFLMAEMFPESFPTRGAAAKWQDFYFATVASKVRAWQRQTLEQAHRESHLVNPFGYQMWFWDVYRWDSKRYHKLKLAGKTNAQAADDAWVLGEDAKSSLAFLPRDTGAAMLKEVLLRLAPLVNEGLLVGTIHDAIVGVAPESRLVEVASALKREQERPVPELGGLSIGVEQKVGRAWGEDAMESYTIPLDMCPITPDTYRVETEVTSHDSH